MKIKEDSRLLVAKFKDNNLPGHVDGLRLLASNFFQLLLTSFIFLQLEFTKVIKHIDDNPLQTAILINYP